jgi:PIN domain nuclease of toxin-antitoxin system
MPALLDTNAFLWLAGDAARLSAAASAYARDPANKLFVSAASAWEIAIKLGLGRLHIDVSLSSLLTEGVEQLSLQWLAIEPKHLVVIPTLAPHHKDPFDRMLVAQCQAENLPLVSADTALDAYGIVRVW